jgi:NAD+ kinase
VKLVGIVLRDTSRRTEQVSSVLIDYLVSRKIEHFIIYSKEGGIPEDLQVRIPKCDLSVAFGGDGTLLFASRVFSRYGIPIVGINLGGLGFITEFREKEVLECVECFMEGHHDYEARMMIDVQIFRQGSLLDQMQGLNDLVVTTGGISRLLEFKVLIGNRLIGTYRADGIIIATPTGSTAYSLAAGGPIVDPKMSAFLISPICPHALGARPLVVPSEEVVKVKVLSRNRKVIATVDGQIAVELKDGDDVHVLRSNYITRLVSVGKRSFYDIVREKLAWKG